MIVHVGQTCYAIELGGKWWAVLFGILQKQASRSRSEAIGFLLSNMACDSVT